MTEAQNSPKVYQTLCPECEESITELADGLCPECGFPLKVLAQHVEQTAATHRSDDLKRERSGRIEGVITHRDDIFGGQIIVLTNTKQLAVGFIADEPEVAVGEHGALQFVEFPIALFLARDTDTKSEVDVQKKNGLQAFTSKIKMPAPTKEYPPSIWFLGALGYLNLFIALSAGYVTCADGNVEIGTALTAQAVLGTILLRVIYHIAASIWQIREVALELRNMKVYSVEDRSLGS